MPKPGFPRLVLPRVSKGLAAGLMGGVAGVFALALVLPNLPANLRAKAGPVESVLPQSVSSPEEEAVLQSEAQLNPDAQNTHSDVPDMLRDALNTSADLHLATRTVLTAPVEDGFEQREAAAWEKASRVDTWASYKAYLDRFGEDTARPGANAKEARKFYYIRSAERAEQVRETRRLLASLGYPVGEGHLMDYRLSAQIVEFERRHNLPVRGDVSNRLLRALQKAEASLKEPKTSAVAFDPCAEKPVS